MLRRLITVWLAMFVLASCSNAENDSTSTKDDLYRYYYEMIISGHSYAFGSSYYDVSGEIISLPDGTYRYYVIIDNPQIAMYNIVTMIVEDDIPYDQATKMMPSIGIYDDEKYYMIPGQVNSSEGYVKGITLSGESAVNEVYVSMVVEWRDQTMANITCEFLRFKLTPYGMVSSW